MAICAVNCPLSSGIPIRVHPWLNNEEETAIGDSCGRMQRGLRWERVKIKLDTLSRIK